MKILVFNWRDMEHPEAGGAELYVFKTMEVLKNMGHEVDFFCGSFKGAAKHAVYKGMRITRGGNRFTTYVHAVFGYWFRLRKKNYDIVIDCVNGFPWFTPLFVFRKKAVMFFHVVGKIFFQQLPFPLSLVGYISERYLMPFFYSSLRFITISKQTKEEMKEIGIKDDKIDIVYCGMDHEQYTAGKRSAKPRIVFVGRLKKYKRVQWLVEIFKGIKDRVKDAEMYVIGSGEEHDALVQRAKDERLDDFYVLGHVSEEEKVRYVQSAWMLANTSSKEGWGLTVIEGNACRVPSVCFNVPGLNESVVDGKTGYLVDDIASFIEKSVMLLKNRKLHEKISSNALAWSRKFTWENAGNEIYDILKRI